MSRSWTVVQMIPALDTGGAERSTLEIGAALVAQGHRSIVISGGGAWVERLIAAGSEHRMLPMQRKSPSALLAIPRLRAWLRQLEPDLIHARSRLPAWLALGARWQMQPRPAFVTTVHGLNSVNRYSAVMTRGDRVIAVSNTTRAHLLAHYPELPAARIRVIPRGVDPARFRPDMPLDAAWTQRFLTEFPMLRGGPLLTLPGRGTRLKGHADAIALLARLQATGSPARLLLLGVIEDGREAYLSELRERARKLGVIDRIAFSRARSDVREILQSSALVLQLSDRPESFGRVVIEALSLKRPVLGYAHGGVGELLDRYYPAGAAALGQLDELTRKALNLLDNPPPVEARPLPSVEQLQRLTLAVYAELIEGAAVDPAFGDVGP